MFENMKLGTRFNFLLSLVFIMGIILSGLALWEALQRRAEAEITTKGLVLIDTMSSVRHYTSNNVRPLLAADLETHPEFIAETVPAFSARMVFDQFRTNEAYADFFYKEATLNPMNLVNQADDFEGEVVDWFEQRPGEKEVSGFRSLAGERVFYIARPLIVNSESCLQCHSDPAIAPVSLINSYGSQSGFWWGLNDIVGTQMIYVPAEEVFNATLRSFLLIISIFIGTFALVMILINVLLQKYVIHPLEVMGQLAYKISDDQLQESDLEVASLLRVTQRGDELGTLAQVFQRMAREVTARTEQLRQKVQKLSIEIDEMKRQEQVSEVTNTDFFKELQEKARLLREQHNADTLDN